MWIKNIKIKNFRNYNKEEINLEKNINIFYGENAQGKTNIIEAIFLCSLGKSFRAKKDSEMIKLNEENSIVEIEFEKSDRDGKIKIDLGNKKEIYLNGIKIKKLSELLGNLNIVIFTPDDINILKGRTSKQKKIFRYNDKSIKTKLYAYFKLIFKNNRTKE
ncbi:MAG: AAA family ATPase [Clostridia bacterium]|nr:AAA family ATPase [Clostridia bacterium]